MSGTDRRSFDTLDGLRAVGAQLVVMRHLPELFGDVPVPESFLAVDLFYLVSGIVMANAYRERLLRGGFLRDFTVTRVIRLYPLYLLGLAIGIIVAAISISKDPHSWWTPFKVIEAVATGLFLIPFFPGLQANGSSLDGPTWTLLPEIAANLVWAVTIKWARWLAIGLVLLISGIGVVMAEFHFKGLDVGYLTGQTWAAMTRAGWSFFAGLVVFHLLKGRRIDSRIVPWILCLLLGLVLAWRPSDETTPAFELSAILLAFPLLALAAALFEPGPRVAKVFSVIGRASWGVYILHEPVARLAEAAAPGLLKAPAGAPIWVVGLAFIVAINAMAWALDKWFEVPVRKWLAARFLKPRPRPEPAAA